MRRSLVGPRAAALLALVPLLPAAFLGRADPVAEAAAGPDGDLAVAEATLAELRAEPDLWLGRRARVTFQLCSLGETWLPWTSRFGPDDYVRIEAWCDTQLPWYREAFDDPAPFLFARRGSVPTFVLEHSHPHERFSAVVVVRELLQREPRIEVLSLVREWPAIGEGAVIHACKAIELGDRGGFELAVSEARRALASPLPDHAAEDLEARVAEWERALRDR